jgi:hypothetical protein
MVSRNDEDAAANARYIDDNIHLVDIGDENLLGGGALFLRRIGHIGS